MHVSNLPGPLMNSVINPKALKCSQVSSSISYCGLPGPPFTVRSGGRSDILLSEYSLEYSLAPVLSIFSTNCGKRTLNF